MMFIRYIKDVLKSMSEIRRLHNSLRLASLFGIAGIIMMGFVLTSCQEFFEPEQELVKSEEEMYKNWEEYRSAEMGLYALQQELVEQLLVLGELRGDLLEITDNATPELREVYNFNITRDNPYASPVNFYKLIIASNRLINRLKTDHPEVLDKSEPINNYDRLYGEALCMRAWAYFNAVRIYGEVPYIHESLNDIEEIEDYVNSETRYVDSVYIDFGTDGYNNDTIRDTTIVLEKRFLDQQAVIDTFTNQLENKTKAVGVNHTINIQDNTWNVSIWNEYARHTLLGKMYLYDYNYTKAIEHFNPILYFNAAGSDQIRYGLDDKFSNGNWENIFKGIDRDEHIFTLWFGKSFQQQNKLQTMFSTVPPNQYMMKPTPSCIQNWESQWNSPQFAYDYDNPRLSRMEDPGRPGDFYRGYGVSYQYFKDGKPMDSDTIRNMLVKKQRGNQLDVELLMRGVDTVVTKFSIGKDRFAQDPNFIIYRAGGVHLYAAEVYALWKYYHGGGVSRALNTSLNIINDGTYSGNPDRLGIRGRVGFADRYEAITVGNIVFEHHPVTNKIIGYDQYFSPEKQSRYVVDKVLEERARELAFEGERFYDLMRVAKRRNDPSYLAEKVASKFSGAKKEAIRQKLMDPQNWYIDYFNN